MKHHSKKYPAYERRPFTVHTEENRIIICIDFYYSIYTVIRFVLVIFSISHLILLLFIKFHSSVFISSYFASFLFWFERRPFSCVVSIFTLTTAKRIMKKIPLQSFLYKCVYMSFTEWFWLCMRKRKTKDHCNCKKN